MKEIPIGDTTIRVRATPLALLYYKQAFKSDLVGDLTKMMDIEDDLSKLDTVMCLQMTYAMAKANAGLGADFPDFVSWVASLEVFDFSDPEVLAAVVEEASDGFFRRGIQQQSEKKRKSKTSGKV